MKIDSKVTSAHERRCQAAFKVNQPGESGYYSKQIEILLNIPFPKVLRVPLIEGAVRVGGGGGQ